MSTEDSYVSTKTTNWSETCNSYHDEPFTCGSSLKHRRTSELDIRTITVYSVLTGKLSSRRDLASLRRVSRYWRDVTSPIFFECWSIESDEGWIWWLDEQRPYQLLEEMSFGFLQLVRHFKVFATFHVYLEHRCGHNRYCSIPAAEDESEDGDKDCLQILGEELRPLLMQLKPNALRSFW